MITYDVVWDGSHHGVNADLLCVPPVVMRSMEHIPRAVIRRPDTAPYQDRSRDRARALELMLTKERWRIRDLRCLLGLTPPVMSGILQRLRRDRLVRSLGHGYITLRRIAA